MTYPAKLLLLGEYTVLTCSHALARPYPAFSGAWQHHGKGADLYPFLQYLREDPGGEKAGLKLDVDRFDRDLDEGWHFESDIPAGYGLGSSGALCAGVYDRYAIGKIMPADVARFGSLQQQLAWMESYFHGSSSATDPMVSYVNRPLLLLRGGSPEPVFLPPTEAPYRIFLLDTGIRRQTGPLVRHFMESCRDARYANAVETLLGPVNNIAIQAWLAGEWESLYQHWAEISTLEYRFLQKMIPESFRDLWEKSMHGGPFFLKICGAGGGGFLLGITRDWYLTQRLLEPWPLRPL